MTCCVGQWQERAYKKILTDKSCYCTMCPVDIVYEPEFLLKPKKIILGIAFSKKVGYLIKNEVKTILLELLHIGII